MVQHFTKLVTNPRCGSIRVWVTEAAALQNSDEGRLAFREVMHFAGLGEKDNT